MQSLRAIYRLRKLIGISCIYTESGARYVLCRLEQRGDKVDIQESRSVDHLDEVKTYCIQYPRYSVALHLQGKGVLLKKMDNSLGHEWNERFIYDVFPNFSEEQYYYTIMQGHAGFWISIVQRERVQQLVDDFAQSSIPIVQLYVGPFVLAAILPQLNFYDRKYLFAGHAIETDEHGKWQTYRYDDTNESRFSLKVADRNISHGDIDAYAVAFNILLNGLLEDYSLTTPYIQHNFAEAQAKRQFKVNGILSLGLIFILLLVSTVAFQYYYAENERLNLTTDRQQIDAQGREKQMQSIAEKEMTLEKLGWNGGVSKAWLLDQIALSLNEHRGIFLTEVAINPRSERKRGAPIGTEDDNRLKILLKGRCVSLEGLNAWVRELSHRSWVQRVQIARFTPSEIYGDNGQVFTLDIALDYAF